MPNLKTKTPFAGTPEQEKQLREVIDNYRGQKGATMPILQGAQAIYGYLPEEVQLIIAESLDLSLSEIYGVVSFYSQFSLNPVGKIVVAVCMGTACYVKGAGEILERCEQKLGIKAGEEVTPDGKFSISAVRCIGACGLAPVIIVGDDVHGRISAADVDGILEQYI
jgi:NADH-quinone oxidoreductase subunit E/NADP-reducing hydrogenase subunit HndA